jgi:hypothetical protein
MRWTSQAAAGLVAMVLAGCSGRDRSHDAGSTAGGGAGTETGSMSDTSSGMSADTGLKGTSADTASGWKESGATDSSGKAPVGKDSAQKTRSDQTQPVPTTSDSLSPGVDSAR